jgi:hypothetical protein
MVIMSIMRVLVEELLLQDSRGWSPMFENLPTRSMWVYGYVTSCPALNDTAPQKTGGHGVCPVLKGSWVVRRGHMARWRDLVRFKVTGESPV